MATVSVALVRELFDYHPDSGHLVRRVKRGSCVAGTTAGSSDAHGYKQVQIDGRLYKVHRIAWLHVHGRWPANQLDHINGDRADNRIANLREASNRQNCLNTVRTFGQTATGLRGVSVHQPGLWRARISIEGRVKHLGLFSNPQEASAAYLAAKRENHAFWAGTAHHEGD